MTRYCGECVFFGTERRSLNRVTACFVNPPTVISIPSHVTVTCDGVTSHRPVVTEHCLACRHFKEDTHGG